MTQRWTDCFCCLSGPFHSSTGNVSARHETDITPAGWTFSIWGVIYTWLTLMVMYITTYVFRGYIFTHMYWSCLIWWRVQMKLIFVFLWTDPGLSICCPSASISAGCPTWCWTWYGCCCGTESMSLLLFVPLIVQECECNVGWGYWQCGWGEKHPGMKQQSTLTHSTLLYV